VIWGPIYAGAIVYALWQAQPSLREDPRLRGSAGRRPPASAAPICGSSSLGSITWATVVVIVWMTASLAPAFLAVRLRLRFHGHAAPAMRDYAGVDDAAVRRA